jgi:ADP-L-glycero-D-manno-heptose 6-epimerase
MAIYVVTGGAGFIGSNIVAGLEARGDDVIVVDSLGTDEKWRNLAGRNLVDIVPPAQLISSLDEARSGLAGVFHMGAISSTTEADADCLIETNFRTSCRLWNWCSAAGVPLIYASSASTYGDGSAGFRDSNDPGYLAQLRPLNAYGWSKHLFDRWVAATCMRGAARPPRWAGLKFFNVYGPNEQHKGSQRSTAHQLFEQIMESGRVALFKSYRPDYSDGGQKRDFVWVEDCVKIALWLAGRSDTGGIYNVGSGTAHSFEDLAHCVFRAMGRKPAIDYIPMPEQLREKYQYFTCADLEKLRSAACPVVPTSLEEGIHQYVQRYLARTNPFK